MSNPLALAVLSCLNERPMHPYEISTTLRSRGKEESIKLSYELASAAVVGRYPEARSDRAGAIREGRRPERTVYEITEAGVTEFERLAVD